MASCLFILAAASGCFIFQMGTSYTLKQQWLNFTEVHCMNSNRGTEGYLDGGEWRQQRNFWLVLTFFIHE